jgi:RNA polymerase sigma-70 factor (ECF subfamily)
MTMHLALGCPDSKTHVGPIAVTRTPDDRDGDDPWRTSNSLLLRLRDRSDQEAWAEFVARYTPMIRRWCHRWFAREADDLVQEVLTKLIHSIEKFDYHPKPGRFRGWLKKVTRNLVKELCRRHPLRKPYATLEESALAAIEAHTDLERRLAEQHEWELLALARERVRPRVDPRTWAAFVRTVEEGCEPGRTAEELGMPIGSVYQAKYNTIRLLKREVAALRSRA